MDETEHRLNEARVAHRDAVDQLTDAIFAHLTLHVTRLLPTADAIGIDARLLDDGRWSMESMELLAVRSGDELLATADSSLEWELPCTVVDPLLDELGDVNGELCSDVCQLALVGTS